MDVEKLLTKLIRCDGIEEMRDALTLCKDLMDMDALEVADRKGNVFHKQRDPENVKKALDYMLVIRRKLALYLRKGVREAEYWYWYSLLLAAPHDFDCFCRYIEKDREPRKRFYEPRRKQLLPVVQAMQRLEDNETDLLAISLPPGTGKSTLEIFFMTWVTGLHPEMQNLMGSHNTEFLRGVYDEVLRILDPDGEYCWCDVFPDHRASKTNAKSLRIDVGRPKRFESIELSSIGSGNAGKVRATAYLMLDDLCEGIEQAMSADRMAKLWQSYTVDYRQRKLGDRVKEIHIQTRWSVNDVVGRLQELYEDNPRAEFINIPALDEDGNSNFEYPYGLGYTKEMLEDIERSMDDASFKALYMGEPIQRGATLFNLDELRRYFDLPEKDPDAILCVCDTKDKGTDYCVMPIVYQYGNDYYIEDVVCDNSVPEVVEERMVQKLLKHKVQMGRFESNAAGGRVAQKVQEQVKERGGITKITTKYTTANKETKILVNSAYVKEHFLFKDDTVIKTDKEYRRFLGQLGSYAMIGKNKNDDAADAMAQLSDYVQTFASGRIEVFQRPW